MSIVVVGSVNQDLVVIVPRHPRSGETVLGSGHTSGPGGKGANQAVAAARLGADVALVARVGADTAGREMVAAMAALGIDVTHVRADAGAGTGVAVVAVAGSGENSIVVSPGANARCAPSDVEAAAGLLDRAEVALLQLEIPLETVRRAAELAPHRLILNPAPARPLPADLLSVVDILVPNRSELGILAGVDEPASIAAAADAATGLAGPGAVVVTLGGDGALLVVGGRATHIPAPEVDVVDTTGAGDAFCGALAAGLAEGAALPDAAEIAVHAGALATTRVGAQAALPDRSDLAAAMSAG